MRLEETLEQLAKQHNHLERAFRGAAQANATADNKSKAGRLHESQHRVRVSFPDSLLFSTSFSSVSPGKSELLCILPCAHKKIILCKARSISHPPGVLRWIKLKEIYSNNKNNLFQYSAY